jgi:hypothetical protein
MLSTDSQNRTVMMDLSQQKHSKKKKYEIFLEILFLSRNNLIVENF